VQLDEFQLLGGGGKMPLGGGTRVVDQQGTIFGSEIHLFLFSFACKDKDFFDLCKLFDGFFIKMRLGEVGGMRRPLSVGPAFDRLSVSK
jgi:hypothetical protein